MTRPRLFARPIKPTIMPMILASVYISGAYFFLRAATASQWHTVKGGFIPVGTFATLMGVATARMRARHSRPAT